VDTKKKSVEKMQYNLSKHAKVQLERRGINASQIDAIINHPDSVVEEDSLWVYQKTIQEENRNYLYRVFVNKTKEPNLVVTAYKTSKLSKYENKV
jgi:hypothetical protein